MILLHAFDSVPRWSAAWRRTGHLVLLLDFDGTLAPLVDRPETAAIPSTVGDSLEMLRRRGGVAMAVVSGRGLADLRERAALPGIVHAGNHGLEMAGDGWRWTHPDAATARPTLDAVADEIAPVVASTDGAWIEDKGLTLTIHFRLADPAAVPRLRAAVEAAVQSHDGVRMTAGRSIVEVRPDVSWGKGSAVLFLLDRMVPPAGTPVLYLGDDTTDEDAFRVLAERGDGAEGIIVADPLRATAARSYLREVEEVGKLLGRLAAQ